MLSEREKVVVTAITEQLRSEIKEASLASVFVSLGAPRLLTKSFSIDRGESVLHAGGELIATRKTSENPDVDPLSYQVVRNGIKAIEFDLSPCELGLSVLTTDGNKHGQKTALAIPNFCGVYKKDAEYPAGSVVIKDKKAVIKDVSGDWRLFFYLDPEQIKGEPGKPGVKGDSIKGDKGNDAPTIEKCYATEDNFVLELSDGKVVPMVGSKAFIGDSLDGFFHQKAIEHADFIKKVAKSEVKNHAESTTTAAIEGWQKEIVRLSEQRVADDAELFRKTLSQDAEEQREKTRLALEQIVSSSISGIEKKQHVAKSEIAELISKVTRAFEYSEKTLSENSESILKSIADDNDQQREKTRAALEQIVSVSLNNIENAEERAKSGIARLVESSKTTHIEEIKKLQDLAIGEISESKGGLEQKIDDFNDEVANQSRYIEKTSQYARNEIVEASNLSKKVMEGILDDFSDSVAEVIENIDKTAQGDVREALAHQIESYALPEIKKSLDTLFVENRDSFLITASEDLFVIAKDALDSLNIEEFIETNLVEAFKIQKTYAKTVAHDAISEALPQRVEKSVNAISDSVVQDKMNEMFIQLDHFAKGLIDDTVQSAIKAAAIDESLEIARSKLHSHFTDYTQSVNRELENMLPQSKTFVSDVAPEDARNGDVWHDTSNGKYFETRVLWDGKWLSKRGRK